MSAERVVIVGNGRMTQACGTTLAERMPGRLQLIVAESRPGPAQARLSKQFAERGVPVLIYEGSINAPETLARIADAKPDLILSIDNFQIFGGALLALPGLGCVNFHNGPLDTYRGVNVPSWAIFNGEDGHGVTWHTMERSVDAGAVLAAAPIPLDGTETALSLTLECIRVGIELFDAHLDRLLAPAGGARVDTSNARLYRRSDTPNGGWLDPSWPAAAIDRMLRATDFRPYPNPFVYAKLRAAGRELIVNETRVAAADPSGRPGDLRYESGKLVLSCADADLEIVSMMLEPGVEASVADVVATLGLEAGRRISLLA